MSAERIDSETLAAFLDGRLSGEERERVLRILAENPEDFDVFADAASVTRALSGASGAVSPIAKARSRRRIWLTAIPALIAAGIGAFVVVPRLRDGDGLSPARLAQRLSVVASPGAGSLAARLGENWDQPGWSVTRGGGTETMEPSRAFRLGARAMDVEIAVQAQDSTALPLVAAELIQLASAVDGGAPAATMYQRIVDRGVVSDQQRRADAADALRALMGDSPWFDLGVWAEAARVAVAAGQDGFLRERLPSLGRLIEKLRARPMEETGELISLLESLETDIRSGTAASDPTGTSQRVRQVMAIAGR